MNALDTTDVRNVERMYRANKLDYDRKHQDMVMEQVSEARRYLDGLCRCGAALSTDNTCEYCD